MLENGIHIWNGKRRNYQTEFYSETINQEVEFFKVGRRCEVGLSATPTTQQYYKHTRYCTGKNYTLGTRRHRAYATGDGITTTYRLSLGHMRRNIRETEAAYELTTGYLQHTRRNIRHKDATYTSHTASRRASHHYNQAQFTLSKIAIHGAYANEQDTYIHHSEPHIVRVPDGLSTNSG